MKDDFWRKLHDKTSKSSFTSLQLPPDRKLQYFELYELESYSKHNHYHFFSYTIIESKIILLIRGDNKPELWKLRIKTQMEKEDAAMPFAIAVSKTEYVLEGIYPVYSSSYTIGINTWFSHFEEISSIKKRLSEIKELSKCINT